MSPPTSFLARILAPFRSGDAGRAEWALKWLLVASIVLPVTIFTIAAAISYRTHVEEAQDRLQRTLEIVYEHALKVFETFDVTEVYLEDLLDNISDDQIRTNEAFYHARLKRITDLLPQLADIWVIDRNGHPVVSGTVYPMRRDLDLSDRPYFEAQKENPQRGVYISDTMVARATNAKGQPTFFALSHARVGPDGSFAGATTISVSPGYFTQAYSELPQPSNVLLVRQDGGILARYPSVPNSGRPKSAKGELLNVVRQGSDGGTLVDSAEGSERLLDYRKLPHRGVYVVVAMNRSDILRTWAQAMSVHLIFGVPATLAMFTLCFVALRRTRRESVAYRQLQKETARREETERALRHSQRVEAIGRLTGGIAHDFNNLLTAILGNIDLALGRLSAGNERARQSLNFAREASQRAATLVARLLSFSRQHPLEVKSVDINRLVQGMSELLRRTIGEAIAIETVLAGGLWEASTDPNQLEGAILNLAVNARDAMPGGGNLTIETGNAYLDEAYAAATGEDVAPGQYIMVAITDSGSGMDAKTIEHAFDPFFTTKPPGAGTGLGLSMVYGFVKQSGGYVRIYSELGEGTTVKLYFPRPALGTDASAGLAEPVREQPAEIDGSNITVLVVEDDPQVSQFITQSLQERGFHVIAAPDGPTALRCLDDDNSISMLLTDVVLPGGMNGRELADEVQRRRPATKVLFATGYTRNAIIHHGRLDAGVDLLNKPFTADALLRKIQQVLKTDETAKV